MLQQAHAPIGGLRQIAGRGVTVIGTSRRRPWLTRALLALTLLTAISAFHGGGSLVADPSGGLIQLSGEWLRLTPFSSYLIPGLLLSLVVGGSNLIAAVALLRRHPYAPWIAGGAGCALTGRGPSPEQAPGDPLPCVRCRQRPSSTSAFATSLRTRTTRADPSGCSPWCSARGPYDDEWRVRSFRWPCSPRVLDGSPSVGARPESSWPAAQTFPSWRTSPKCPRLTATFPGDGLNEPRTTTRASADRVLVVASELPPSEPWQSCATTKRSRGSGIAAGHRARCPREALMRRHLRGRGSARRRRERGSNRRSRRITSPGRIAPRAFARFGSCRRSTRSSCTCRTPSPDPQPLA